MPKMVYRSEIRLVTPTKGEDYYEKCCTRCGEWKSLDKYWKNKQATLGVESICKLCRNTNNTNHKSNDVDNIISKEVEVETNLVASDNLKNAFEIMYNEALESIENKIAKHVESGNFNEIFNLVNKRQQIVSLAHQA